MSSSVRVWHSSLRISPQTYAKDNIKILWDYGIGHIGLMECHKWNLNQ